MTGTATFIKQVNGTGDGKVFRLDPPLADYDGANPTEYVWVSAVTLPGFVGGTETYIFASNENGEVTDWLELPGSMKDTLDHAEALRAAGYEVTR